MLGGRATMRMLVALIETGLRCFTLRHCELFFEFAKAGF